MIPTSFLLDAAPAELLVVFVVAAILIAPSLALLYSLDQRSRLHGHDLGGVP